MNRSTQSSRAGVRVRLNGITKHFGELRAVDSISLDVEGGTFFSLLGPSGCGKSTTLRIISGFEIPDEGQVLIGEEDVTTMEARKRPTAMVFQNYALFPHMTVGENVAYGLKVKKLAQADLRAQVTSSLDRVGMGDFLNTPVTSLSGGQQQRTALARAIAIEPQVILFDEPLSNLDVALRRQTRKELKQLQHRLGLTSIYVTHDQEEALALSDVIALMRDGEIVQMGSPEQLYNNPETAFVASFLGGSNIISEPDQIDRFTSDPVAKGHVLSIRAEDIRVSEKGSFEAKVISRQFLGAATDVVLQSGPQLLNARLTECSIAGENIRFNVLASRAVKNDIA